MSTATIDPLDGDTASGVDEALEEAEFDFFGASQPESARFAAGNDGEIFDAEVVGDDIPPRDSRLRGERVETPDRDASNKIPSVDEWMHFFSNIVIRVLTDYYIQLAFSGIDENLLTDREIDLVTLSVDERARIGRPFAEFSNKNKFMRKHGREIIASGDSIDAALMLGLWFSRVNRISRRVRAIQESGQQPPVRPKRERRRYGVNRPAPAQQPVPDFPRQPPVPASRPDVSSEPPEPMNGAFTSVSPQSGTTAPNGNGSIARVGRPDINGVVYSPGSS